ncbi:hypothetical protein [Aliifodinibius sp. S!AR15-10]|nr:hypothetical protein [Aliifodinibius sp. S!AR15-10]
MSKKLTGFFIEKYQGVFLPKINEFTAAKELIKVVKEINPK